MNAMNAKTVFVVAALAALASTAARADDITIDSTPFHGQRTRAEVQAELMQFRQAGVNPWAINYDPLKYYEPKLTREQVRAEFLAGRNEVAAMTREDSGSAYLSQMAAANSSAGRTNLAGQPQLTREQVRAEFLANRNQVAAMTGEDSGSAYLSQLAAAHARADQTYMAGAPANTN